MDEKEVAAPRPRARWSRLAALGLILAAIGPLLPLTAALVWGLEIGGEAAFFLIPPAVAVVGAYLVWSFGTWAKIVAIVVAVLVGGALFWTAFGLTSPGSFFDFVPGLLVMPGALLALVSSVAAIVAQRRGHLTTGAEGGERRGIRIAVSVVVVLAALSGILTVVGRSSLGDTASASVTVRQADFEFDRARYSVAGGERVLVRNTDPFLHTFTVDALDIDITLTPGSDKLVQIPSRPGIYVLYCRPHTVSPDEPEEDDMAAELRVT